MTVRTGRNINVSLNDGLYYIPYTAVNMYKHKKTSQYLTQSEIPQGEIANYKFDLAKSQAKYDEWLKTFKTKMRKRCPSFQDVDVYTKRDERIVLENKMFQIVIEDNAWGFAVELLSRPDCRYKSLQKHSFKTFLKVLCNVLLTTMPVIYIRNGAWSVEPITANTEQDMLQRINAYGLKLDKRLKATVRYNNPPTNRPSIMANMPEQKPDQQE